MKQEENIEFMEIPDVIPFKKVTSLKLQKVSFNPQTSLFRIQIAKKCEDIPKEHISIERSLDDMNWLIMKLEVQNKKNIVIPALPSKSYWQSLKGLTSNFSKNYKNQLMRDEETIFLCKCISRFFKVLEEVIVKNIINSNSKENSLFTFIDEKYKLYKLQVYQKDESNTLSAISQKLASGGKKIFGMIYPWKSTKKAFLQNQFKKIEKLIEKTTMLKEQLTKMDQSLKLLGENFINEQTALKGKEMKIFNKFMKVDTILKILELIKLQMGNTVERSSSDHGLDLNELEGQIGLYGKMLIQDFNGLEKELSVEIRQFYECLRETKVRIEIGSIYHISQN